MRLKQLLATIVAAAMLPALIPMTSVRAETVGGPLPLEDGYTRYECEDGYLHYSSKESNRWGDASGAGNGSWVFGLGRSLPAELGIPAGTFTTLDYDFGNVRHVRLTVDRQESGVVTLRVGYMTQGTTAGPGGKYFALKVNEEGSIRRMELDNVRESNNMWRAKDDPAGGNENGYWMGMTEVEVDMEEGENTIYISGSMEGNWFNLDYVDVSDATDTTRRTEPVRVPILPGGNPFVTSIFTADPSARVGRDGRLYVYPSHDVDPSFGEQCHNMDRYHVYSTDNMVDWRDEGEIWRSEQVEWDETPADYDRDPNGLGADHAFLWAPDCIYRDGKYYFYYPKPLDLTDWNNTWVIGVLVSDYPDKGFRSLGYLKEKDGTPWHRLASFIDPHIFEDDDGRFYIFNGGGGRAWYAELDDDMVTVKEGSTKQIHGTGAPSQPLNNYHEGPWVFKRNDTYYFTYPASGGGNGDRMFYATAPSIDGPWTNRGMFLDTTGCGTSHGSVVEYKGHWYLFYHNKAIGSEARRSICVDELFFNEDGTIRQVVQTTTGPEAIGPRVEPGPVGVTYQAEAAELVGPAAENVIETDEVESGGAVRIHAAGAAVTFHNVSGGEKGGRATLRFHYANGDSTAKWRLTVNGEDWLYINLMTTGSVNFYCGYTDFTVPLEAGDGNTITIERAAGRVMLDCLEVYLLDEYEELEPMAIYATGDKKTLEEGGTFTVTATVTGDAENRAAVFSVSDEAGLSIESTAFDGGKGETTAVVKALKAGSYIVYADTVDGEQRAEVAVTVTKAAEPVLLGDIDADGSINTTDARLALQHAVEKITLTEDQLLAADVDGSGKVDTTDARLILQYAVEKIDSFPAEQ